MQHIHTYVFHDLTLRAPCMCCRRSRILRKPHLRCPPHRSATRDLEIAASPVCATPKTQNFPLNFIFKNLRATPALLGSKQARTRARRNGAQQWRRRPTSGQRRSCGGRGRNAQFLRGVRFRHFLGMPGFAALSSVFDCSSRRRIHIHQSNWAHTLAQEQAAERRARKLVWMSSTQHTSRNSAGGVGVR
jgi:hypothetical protein